MGLIYDDPDLAALTLVRIVADESEGPGCLDGRMCNYLSDLEQRNGADYVKTLAVALARAHFKTVDDLARATGTESAMLLNAAEVDALDA
jgi:hypothetical protein